jgi:hypothetical protein
MAITVQYAPSAALVAQAAQVSGQGDYNRWAQQQQFQEKQLAQQRDLTVLNVANDQYMQKIGVLDTQFRQRESIADSQTQQLRNIAAQQGLAAFDATNQNYRFTTGVASDQYMQTQRLQTDLQSQQNSIQDAQFRQNQQIQFQNLSEVRNIQAQNQRLQASLQMDRVNTLTQLQARQQEQQAQFVQQQRMSMLDTNQRAGLMGLQSNLSARQSQIDQSNRIQAMNLASKDQLSVSAALADQKFRQQYFQGEYGSAYTTMNDRQFEQANRAFTEKRNTMNQWLKENGFAEGSPEYQQSQRRLMEEYAGIQSQAPLYTQAEQEFRQSLVNDNGTMYIRNPNGSYDLLPDPNERKREIEQRGHNEIYSTNQGLAMQQYNAVYQDVFQSTYAGADPMADDAARRKEADRVARQQAKQAYNEWMKDSMNNYANATAEMAGM